MSASRASAALDGSGSTAGAWGRNEEAFSRLVEPQLTELHAHCYRMLGSLHDAEDALQDTLLRAWRGMRRFDHERPARPWLYRIATNVCLNAIAQRSRRARTIHNGLATPTEVDEPDEAHDDLRWFEPYPDERLGIEGGLSSPEARYERREALEIAFVSALQHLSGRQRAVLILRDVLGFSAKEVADTLDTTPVSVNSALQRARNAVAERLPEQSQQATMRSLGDRRVKRLVRRFVDAFERGDANAIVALLADDAKLAMPPETRSYRGRKAIAASWLMPEPGTHSLRYVLTHANGQLAFGAYRLHQDAGAYVPIALDVLAIRGDYITEIIAFRTPDVFDRLGLPAALPMVART